MKNKNKSFFEKMMNTVSKLPFLKGSRDPKAKKKELFKEVSPQDVSESLKDLSEQEFELLVHRIFIQRGYLVADKRDGAFDGVDLILQRNGESTYVQYQNWQEQQVDETDLGEFYVAMEVDGVKHGIVITSGEFSADALDFSLGKSLMLINGIDLSQMIEALPSAGDVNNEEQPEELKQETPGSEQQEMPELEPLCPICSQKMIKRTAKKGKNAGNTFWGCSKFPSCRGVVST